MEKYGNIIYTNEARAKQFNDFIAWATDYDNNTGLANRTFNAHKTWLTQTASPTLEITENLTLEEKLNLILETLKK